MSSLPRQPEDPNRDPAAELPDALVAELRNAYGRTVPVPPLLDASILREARAGFARRRRFRLMSRGALVTAAAAAGVALVLVIPAMMTSSDPPQNARAQPGSTQMLTVAPAPGEDVDRNGKVDILDAFVVARLIDARAEIDRAYDVNGDGAVDQSDVDRIAMAAVDTSRRRGDEHARVQ